MKVSVPALVVVVVVVEEVSLAVLADEDASGALLLVLA